MTPRERVTAVLQKKTPDRLPREIKLTPALLDSFKMRTGSDDLDAYYQLETREVFFKQPAEMADFGGYYPDGVPPLPNPVGWEVGEWGVGQTTGSALHFVHIESPMLNLTDVSELDIYPFPDLTKPERHEHLEAEVKAFHEQGLFVIGFMEWTIFEISWQMRGMDNLFSDFVFNPHFADHLLDRVAETRCFQARRFAEAGVDMIRIGDDVGSQRSMLLSPDMYRNWLKSRHAKVIAAAREVAPDLHISYHSDGAIDDVIPDLIDIGVSVLNPVQPECMDLAAIKREYGRDLVFWGGIGTQTTMPFASAREVYETVNKTIETLGPTGFFPAPTHVLEPEVPWENIEAYLHAVEAYDMSF